MALSFNRLARRTRADLVQSTPQMRPLVHNGRRAHLLGVMAFCFVAGCDGGPDIFRPIPEPTGAEPDSDAGVVAEPEPIESPCRPIRCGDGVVDAPESCDPQDPETQEGCNENCQTDPPSGWTCYSLFFGDGFCDCGCGIPDPDCLSTEAAACEHTHCPAQHVPLPGNTSRCTLVEIPGDTCETPLLLTGLTGSVSGTLDATDDFDGFLYTDCTFDPSTGIGGDVVYRLNVPDNTILEVKMLAEQFAPTVFVLSECGVDPATCVGAGENFLQRNVAELELYQFTGADADVFIIVDSYAGQGDYTLSWRELENPQCGDGVRDPYDDCDDNNIVPGDGCDENCRIEPNFACPLEGGPCVEAGCGNSIVENSELCDDGNNDNGDGCSANCQFEPPAAWTCPVVYFGSDDGCDCGCGAFDTDCPTLDRSSCQYENCNSGVTQDEALNYLCRIPVCGDNIIEGGEECDDGNEVENDGCFDCRREAPADWTCPARWYGADDGCHCGCGVVDTDCGSLTATCDVNGCLFGGPDPTDNSACIVGTCGDRIVDIGELCDDGNTISGDGCGATCQYIEDGFVCDGNQETETP